MTDQSVFTQTENEGSQPATPEANPNSVFADQLASIKNEEGAQKYDSIEKALNGLQHSQEYIPQLKTELSVKDAEIAKLRAELDQRNSVEDVVSRLTATPEPEPASVPQSPQTDSLSREAVEEIFSQMLNQREQQSSVVSNVEKVNAQLKKQFGDKANSVVAAKATELGSTPQALQELAGSSPEMVLALFNQTANAGSNATTGSIHIPPSNPNELEPLKAPEKSLLRGASGKDQREFMAEVRKRVHAKHGITS